MTTVQTAEKRLIPIWW